MTAAALPPSLAVNLMTAGQGWISKQASAPEIRAAIVAWTTKDALPALHAFVGVETGLVLGAVPFVGGLLRMTSGLVAGGIDSGADVTIKDLVAILVADPAAPSTPPI